MTARVLVKDRNTSATILMWEVDAEEAVRRDPARYTHVTTKIAPPVKNPGGRGY